MSTSDKIAEKSAGYISRHFDFVGRKTNLQTEMLAGLSTYLSLAYIFIVNPAILSQTGINASAVLFATVVVSAAATFAMGWWANLPFAVAPGLEMNGFFAFVVCSPMAMHLSWQQGLGIVFVSGLLCIIFTISMIRHQIIESIPVGLKKSIAASVGVFVATIGLFLAKLVSFTGGKIDLSKFDIAAFDTHLAFVLYAGLFISALLYWPRLRIPGGMLVAIVVGAALCHVWGISADNPPAISADMFSAVGKLDFSVIWHPAVWTAILIFFVVDFIGGIGKFIGLTASTSIQDENGRVPKLPRALMVDGVATTAGALLGTSSLIAFVESAVGIKAGGRTGFAAMVCATLMVISILFTPILKWVPSQAAAGVLVFVGYLLLPARVDANGRRAMDAADIIIGTVMAVVAFVTFSLDKSLAIGFGAYFIKSFFDKELASSEHIAISRTWLAGIFLVLVGTIVYQLIITPH